MQSNLLSTLLHLKVEENSRTFQGLTQKFKDLSRKKMEFKDFSRTPTKIQGLFKTVRTLDNVLSVVAPSGVNDGTRKIYYLMFIFKSLSFC